MHYGNVTCPLCGVTRVHDDTMQHFRNHCRVLLQGGDGERGDVGRRNQEGQEERGVGASGDGDHRGEETKGRDGTLQLRSARAPEDLVAHCQVVQAKRACFANLLKREGGGKKVENLLERARARDGKRQWGPRHRDPY